MTAPATAAPIRVLLVEDNPGDARLILELLRELGQTFALEQVDRLEGALERLGRAGVDVVLLDLGLPDSQGLATFEATQREARGPPIIVISGLDDERVALEAVRSGAQDYLVKGRIEGQLLARVIRYAIERKRSELKLAGTASRLRALMEHAGDGIAVLRPDAVALEVNPSLARLLGRTQDEIVGRRLRDFSPADAVDAQRSQFEAAVREGSGQVIGARFERPNGKVSIVDFSVSNVEVGGERFVLAIGRDVTEQRSLEQQLRQAQKMEAVGRLAGGVAHDFNNVLTAIFGYAELVAEEFPPGSPVHEDLGEIRKAATRAAGLTRQLLAFSRQQVLEPVVLNLNDLVEDVDKMLRRLTGEDVEFRFALDPAIGNVRADAGQLQQVLLNLVVNSRDAMPQGGKLLIETTNAELDEAYAQEHVPVVPGSYVRLAVSDTGVGMDAETISHIFEPFFTTKEKGQGTGLGLSTVYGIVKQSGGYVWVYSELGKGTTFKIYLPRVDAPATSVPGTPSNDVKLTGTETILVAEDDEILRPLAEGLLRKLGYTVLSAANAVGALTLARQHQGAIHLLIADVVMPGGSGRDLARELEIFRGDTRVLYISGYTDDAIVHHGMLEPGLAFLQKPFTPASLARKVREVLEAP